MSAELWAFLDEVIERVTAGVVRRAPFPVGDLDDFRQDARLLGPMVRRSVRLKSTSALCATSWLATASSPHT